MITPFETAVVAKIIAPLKLLNFGITGPVVQMWTVSGLMTIGLIVGGQLPKVRAGLIAIVSGLSAQIGDVKRPRNAVAISFTTTLFLFLLIHNLSGQIPLIHPEVAPHEPHYWVSALTSNINFTAALAVGVFLLSHVVGIWRHGLRHFVNIIPSGLPIWMLPIMVPLELISQLARPFSLAVRLFANMTVGHLILTIFVGAAIVLAPLAKLFPVAGMVVVSLFEVFVSVIQAFIFTYLSAFYIAEASQGGHGH